MTPLLLAAAIATTSATWSQDSLGKVELHAPAPADQKPLLLIWLDGGAHATPKVADLGGASVVRVDVAHYLAAIEKKTSKCYYPAGDGEELAMEAERRLGWKTYTRPIIAGDGVGAELAYEAAASAPEGTFSGAISVGFTPTFDSPKGFCEVTKPRTQFDAAAKKATLQPVLSMKTPWSVIGATPPDAFVPLTSNVRGLTVLEAVHALLPDPVIAAPSPSAGAVDISDLPLHVIEPDAGAPPSKQQVVLLTGDGGWAGIDKALAAAFAKAGHRTIGWDSLSYYWTERTPDQAAADLARILRAQPADDRFLLVGYSFGADDAPFLVNRLPAELAARVDHVVMIAPSFAGSFVIHPIDWLVDTSHKTDVPSKPEIVKLTASKTPVLCVTPDDDHDTPCRDASLGMTMLEVAGGHHMNGDYDAVAAKILEKMK